MVRFVLTLLFKELTPSKENSEIPTLLQKKTSNRNQVHYKYIYIYFLWLVFGRGLLLAKLNEVFIYCGSCSSSGCCSTYKSKTKKKKKKNFIIVYPGEICLDFKLLMFCG